MLKRAVERDLEIIGEAMNRIVKKDESFQKKSQIRGRLLGFGIR